MFITYGSLISKVREIHPAINMVHIFQNFLMMYKPSIFHVKKGMFRYDFERRWCKFKLMIT